MTKTIMMSDVIYPLIEDEGSKQSSIIECSMRDGFIFIVDKDGVEWRLGMMSVGHGVPTNQTRKEVNREEEKKNKADQTPTHGPS